MPRRDAPARLLPPLHVAHSAWGRGLALALALAIAAELDRAHLKGVGARLYWRCSRAVRLRAHGERKPALESAAGRGT